MCLLRWPADLTWDGAQQNNHQFSAGPEQLSYPLGTSSFPVQGLREDGHREEPIYLSRLFGQLRHNTPDHARSEETEHVL